MRAKEEAKYKVKILDHDVCTGVIQVMENFIVKSVDEEWIAEIEDEVMGFTNKTPIEILEHLKKRGVVLDYVDTN